MATNLWQACPICEGTGINPRIENNIVNGPCPKCKGSMVISQLNGRSSLINEEEMENAISKMKIILVPSSDMILEKDSEIELTLGVNKIDNQFVNVKIKYYDRRFE